jgi:hypothetical protein
MTFDPFKAPNERDISKLGTYVEELHRYIRAGVAAWSISGQGFEGEQQVASINLLLALHKQLNWIFRVFKGLPNISVSVR